MNKRKQPRPPKLVGYKVTMRVDGRVFIALLKKNQREQLRELLSKNKLQGVEVTVEDIREQDGQLANYKRAQ